MITTRLRLAALSAADAVADKVVTAAFSIATAYAAVIALVAPKDSQSPFLVLAPFIAIAAAITLALLAAELLDRAALLSESTRFQRYGIGSPMLTTAADYKTARWSSAEQTKSRRERGRAGGLALDHSLEHEDMTGPTMIREVDVRAHPNKLPILIFEFAQMLMKHSRVKPRIHACQVPNVDCVLDRPHQTVARVQLVYC